MSTPKKMGRPKKKGPPVKFNAKKQDKYCKNLIKCGGFQLPACKATGISPTLVQKYQRENKTFKKKVIAAHQELERRRTELLDNTDHNLLEQQAAKAKYQPIIDEEG